MGNFSEQNWVLSNERHQRGSIWGPGLAGQPITTARSVLDNAWHHVVLTSADSTTTGSTQSMYLDGGLIGTVTGQIATSAMAYNQIGAGFVTGWASAPTTGWSYFTGQIADVALYTTGLSAQQVAAHNTAGRATLTHMPAMGAVAFTASGLAVAAGSLPVAPVSVPHKIRVEYRNPVASTPNLTLWAKLGTAGAVEVPSSAYGPRYGLGTYSATDDTGGVTPAAGQPAQTVTATSYAGSGLDPVYGLATDQIVDPAGLALDTKSAYEAPSSTTGYLRPTTTALPSANIANAAQSRTTVYYADTETRANPCVAGSPALNQGGLPKMVTDPAPATGTAIQSEVVYDAQGHPLASRIVSDGASWTCTTYDNRSRVTQVAIPALNGSPARTITTTYAVAGNPLVTSVSDPAGTITTTVDLLGRAVSYTDVKNTTTTTTFDQAGRATKQITTPAGGGATSTVAMTYLNDGRLDTESVDGTVVSTASYDTHGEPTGVTYPTLVGGTATPAFVQQTSTHQLNKTAVTVTPSTVLTAGNRLVVQVGVWGAAGASAASVTDSTGEVFTKVLDQVASDSTQLSVWTAPVTAGAGTKPVITVTSTANADVGVVAAEYSGLSTDGTAVDVRAASTGTTGAPGTVSSGQAGPASGPNELAVGFYADSGFGSTLSAGAGWTQRANVSGATDLDLLVQDQIIATGTAVASPTTTGANTPWTAGVVVFKPAGAPATTTTTATPAFVQQASTHQLNKTTVQVTPTSPLGGGNRLVVQVGVWANPAATAAAVSDTAGDVFTKVTSFTASDHTEMSVWTAPVTAGAGQAPVITVTPTAMADVGVVAVEYAGLSATGTGVDVSAHATGTTSAAGSVSSGSTTSTLGANELAVGFYSDSGFGDTLTPGTGFTQRANLAPASDVELLVQDKLIPAGATVTSTVGTGANTTWEAAVVVFTPATTTSTPPPVGGVGAVSTFTRNPQGAQTGVSYALPGSRTLSDTVTRSQAGRVMTATAVKNGTGLSAWAYTYDSAGRLTQGALAANGPSPAVTYGYTYTPTGGCGADPGAGLDGARTSSTVKVGAAAPTTTTSCTDYASRLTSATGGGAMTYNTHGDATTIGTQSFTYDATDRVTAGSAGGTNQAVTYTLDATGRTVTRVGTGTAPGVDTSTATYSYTGPGDTPDLQLTGTNTIGERYLSLPGGVLYTKRYAATGGDIWALPNLHGDTLTTTNANGTLTGTLAIYDPYGNPLAQATGVLDLTTDPTTRTGGLTDGWVGSHQRGTEHTGTANWTLMGARTYLPGYGQFTTTDPIYAGNTNPYTYPQDPINTYDLTGQRSWDWANRARTGVKRFWAQPSTRRYGVAFAAVVNIALGVRNMVVGVEWAISIPACFVGLEGVGAIACGGMAIYKFGGGFSKAVRGVQQGYAYTRDSTCTLHCTMGGQVGVFVKGVLPTGVGNWADRIGGWSF
ncbi:MAG: LamG-like jellyroll fold domain-containing protein [Cellulomonas sp.]